MNWQAVLLLLWFFPRYVYVIERGRQPMSKWWVPVDLCDYLFASSLLIWLIVI